MVELAQIKARLPRLVDRLRTARSSLVVASKASGFRQEATDALFRNVSDFLLGQRVPGKRLAAQAVADNRNRLRQARETKVREQALDVATEVDELLGDAVQGVEPRTLAKWKKHLRQVRESPPARTDTVLRYVEKVVAEIAAYTPPPPANEIGSTAATSTSSSMDPTERFERPAAGKPAWEACILDELATVFYERDEAVVLITKAGFPRARIPEFKTPQVFWTKVLEEARNGLLRTGIQPIVDHAATMYPGNVVFAGARRRASS